MSQIKSLKMFGLFVNTAILVLLVFLFIADQVKPESGSEKFSTSADTDFSIAIFQSNNPWDYTSNQDVLNDIENVTYKMYDSSDIGKINIDNYDKIILPSDQDQIYYDSISDNIDWFEEYVSKGGDP